LKPGQGIAPGQALAKRIVLPPVWPPARCWSPRRVG
jgi:hypothetical protein